MIATTTTRCSILVQIADLNDEIDCATDARDAVAACDCAGCRTEWASLGRAIIRMRAQVTEARRQLVDYPA